MQWNWQDKNWPNFTYKPKEIEGLEQQFLQSSGMLKGVVTHLGDGNKKQLTVEFISTEALKTSEIEGEYLNRDSLQSSIRRHFGLATDKRKIPPAEQGIADMMLDLYDAFDTKLSHKTLFSWHKMLCAGRGDMQDIGKYRTHEEPMQVISGPMHKPSIHFEAPPSAHMKKEMTAFIQWFNASRNTLPPLARASIAHLYFVCIHPFEDGNGRIGRAIAEKTLAEYLGRPSLIALSYTIQKHKKLYYNALEKANKRLEVTEWIRYFAATLMEAQDHTLQNVEFLIRKTQFFEALNGELNERQTKVLLRLFDAGPEGFKGGLSAENYLALTLTSRATATRDLQDLVEKGALVKKGELKGTRYFLS